MTNTDKYRQFQQQLSDLVAIPSISSAHADLDFSNLPVVEYLAERLRDINFKCEIIEVPNEHKKYNLIATLGTGPGGLVLSGHTDTVPYDQNRWLHDPFTLTEKDGCWFGLGATDMKGFFPVILSALESFKDIDLTAPVIVLATADEESSMSGAKALTELGKPKGRYAVIGEPTGLKPIRAHKGIMMESIRVSGVSGHSSNPALGRNALEDMHLVIGELLQFRQELQQRFNNSLFDITWPSLNPGYIHGGDNPNRICGHCELHFDIRPLPGMDLDELRQMLEHRLERLRSETGMTVVLESLFPGVPAYEQSADSALVRAAESLTGHSAQSVAFATEAPFLQQLGHDTIVLGPGSIDQAHQPNEFIDIEQMFSGAKTIESLIRKLCT